MQFCSQCGLRLGDGARYCGVCGRDAYAPATPPPIPVVPPTFGAEAAVPVPPVAPPPAPAPANRGVMIVAAVAIAASLVITAYVLVIAPTGSGADTEQATAQIQTRFVTAKANIRNRPAVTGSAIVGQVERGARLTGALVPGPDARYPWLELADGRGFVSSVNLAAQAPPALARSFADVAWFAEGRTVLLAAPYESSSPVETIADRARVILTGVTGNGFVEVKRSGGGVGYFRAPDGFDPERQVQPIQFRLSDRGCDYGAQFQLLFSQSFGSNQPMAGAGDGVASRYQAIEREMLGLNVTAIGRHSGSSSIHFQESASQVADAFAAAGYSVNVIAPLLWEIKQSDFEEREGVAAAYIGQAQDEEFANWGEGYFSCGS